MASTDPHGIEHEPHLSSARFVEDASEAKAARQLHREYDASTEADAVEHTVWSEPALSAALVGEPDEQQVTYRRWLTKNIEQTTWLQSYGVMLLVAIAAGPWAIFSAMFLGFFSGSGFAILMYTVFGPVAEEVAKVAAAMWVIEKRPFLFRSIGQVFFCAASGGLAFAAIENLLYMYVYFPRHSPEFANFRWTVCVFLHVSCSLIAGGGLARIWVDAIRNLHPPRLELGVWWFVSAMVLHGLYNFTVIVGGTIGWLDLGIPEPAGAR